MSIRRIIQRGRNSRRTSGTCRKRRHMITSKYSQRRKIYSLQSDQAIKTNYCLRGNFHSIVRTNSKSSISERMNQLGAEFKIVFKGSWKWNSKSSNTCKNFNRPFSCKMISVSSILRSQARLALREVSLKLDLTKISPSPNPWWIVSIVMMQE